MNYLIFLFIKGAKKVNNANTNIGKKIKELRKAKRLRQNDFENVGCSQSYISLIESGKAVPDVAQLIGIANVLNVSILNIIDIDINKDNFLSILEKLDQAVGVDLLEIRAKNGKVQDVLYFKDDEIQKKLRTYKLIKDLSKSELSESDLFVYQNKIDSINGAK